MSTNSAASAPAPIKPRFYHTVASLPPGKVGWCEHWAVVVNAEGKLQINPEAEVFYHRQSEAGMFIERTHIGFLRVIWDFEHRPVGTYDQPPVDWPKVIVHSRGIRIDDESTMDQAITTV